MLYSADTQYQYDAQGNRTQHTEHNGETQRYYYNQLNQLQRVDRYSADNRLTRSLYRYDPLGRRLVKQVEHYRIDSNQLHEAAEPEVEFYGWDGDRLAFTQTADSQWHIIYEPESFTPLLQLQHATDAPISEQDKVLAEVMGSLQSTLNYLPAHEAYELARTVRERTVAQLKANEQWQTPELPEECYFYHCNHLGLPEALTNQKGEAVWAASYDAWGTIKEEHNPNNLHQPIRLPGQYHDTETGLYYNRHRYYDPKLGSYINQDPIGLEGGDNYYNYALNLPTQLYDPTGLFIPLVVLAGIAGKALIGAAIGASVEVGMQAGKQVLGQVKENWDEGRPLFEDATDCIDIDYGQVAVSGAVGAVAPGLLSTAKTVYTSGKAISTISGQAANTANRAAKLAARKQTHVDTVKQAIGVQAVSQTAKALGKCAVEEEKKRCDK